MKPKEITVPKFPRVIVSAKRHEKLMKAAVKAKMTLQDYAEAIFKAADKAPQK